jgi:uncharacterized protein (DUF305 family)
MYTLRLKQRAALGAVVAVAVAGVAACSGTNAGTKDQPAAAAAAGAEAPMAGMAGMPKVVIPRDADYTVADVQFMQGMIDHHAQALVMARMAPSHGAGRLVSLLCKKIDISQNDEIRMMSSWLKDRNQVVPDPNDPHPMMMPGMLTPAQLAQLDKARGVEFDRDFLTFMIQHHQGAVKMVADLFASPGGGQVTEMFEYASSVSADQTGEIGKMQDMLSSLPGTNSQ